MCFPLGLVLSTPYISLDQFSVAVLIKQTTIEESILVILIQTSFIVIIILSQWQNQPVDRQALKNNTAVG